MGSIHACVLYTQILVLGFMASYCFTQTFSHFSKDFFINVYSSPFFFRFLSQNTLSLYKF